VKRNHRGKLGKRSPQDAGGKPEKPQPVSRRAALQVLSPAPPGLAKDFRCLLSAFCVLLFYGGKFMRHSRQGTDLSVPNRTRLEMIAGLQPQGLKAVEVRLALRHD